MNKKITDITQQTKKENRVSVFLDGHFWLGMDKETLVMIPELKIGNVLSEEKQSYIQEEVIRDEALSKALNFLNWRMRSQKEVEKKLSEQEYQSHIIEKVIHRLVAIGYINDRNFAEELLRSCIATGHGPKWFLQKAYAAGIDKSISNDVLETWETEDQVKDALQYAQTNRYSSLPDQKIFSRLANRGYDFDVIKKVVTKLQED